MWTMLSFEELLWILYVGQKWSSVTYPHSLLASSCEILQNPDSPELRQLRAQVTPELWTLSTSTDDDDDDDEYRILTPLLAAAGCWRGGWAASAWTPPMAATSRALAVREPITSMQIYSVNLSQVCRYIVRTYHKYADIRMVWTYHKCADI